MPKILKRELAWLARDTPGFEVFHADKGQGKKQLDDSQQQRTGPLRLIAHRGTEVFVGSGKELRWSDVALMRDAGEGARQSGEDHTQVYRVLQTPISRPIRQLSISPSGEHIAIATDYTCHIAVLPSHNLLHSGEHGPLKLKCFQLGPTIHVLEKAPLMSIVWHPLAATGHALITVTKDSCVRMWEVDRDNRGTFDNPSLAVDLRKLSNASSQLDNFGTSTWGSNKGYSVDDEEMQVASACFGGQGFEDEHGWGSMTLWIAMTEGGVYALCPFLPSKWIAPNSMLPSLTTSVVSKARAITKVKDVSEAERRVSEQQSRWLADIDAQEPTTVRGEDGFETVDIYNRPDRPGAIPRLQGPYFITPESEIGDITDIHVIPPKIDDEELYDEDEFEEAYSEDALSVGVICLSSSTGKVHICLDLNEVEAEWLPARRPRGFTFADNETDNSLLLLETVDVAQSEAAEGWSTLTASPSDRYELFTTQHSGVYSLSLRPWISRLETELANPSDPGAEFRFNILLESAPTAVSRPIELQSDDASSTVAVLDPAEGYLLLTVASGIPHSALLEPPAYDDMFAPDDFKPAGALPAPEPRMPYQAADGFFTPSGLPQLMKDATQKRVLGSDLKSQVRFSSATLQLMTDAHRVLSKETHGLGEAASELFVRVNRMQEEIQEQLRQVRDISQRVDGVLGIEEDGKGRNKDKIDNRIEQAQEKTSVLNQRVDALRKKLIHLGGTPLSAREKAFAEEVKTLDISVGGAVQAPTNPAAIVSMEDSDVSQPSAKEVANTPSLVKRLEEATSLRVELLEQVDKIVEQQAAQDSRPDSRRSITSGGHFRRQKIEEVWDMLDVESALVGAVKERLDKLSV